MGEVFIVRRGGGSVSKGAPQYTYTGRAILIDEGNENWKMKFLSSGTLTFTKLNNAKNGIDVFLVGGGGGGSGSGASPGAGGGGGYTKTLTHMLLAENTQYSITIGAGGAAVAARTDGKDGGDTSAFSLIAAGGKKGNWDNEYGGNGGSGGAAYNSSYVIATNGGDGTGSKKGKGQISLPGPNNETGTTREFEEADGELYSNGGASAYSGGTGQTLPRSNYGDGGHGGTVGNGGTAGADGIVIIRNAR